jgi:hypothetical protein
VTSSTDKVNRGDPELGHDPLPLLKARLWVARLGESDLNRWWRTDGVLGRDGAFVGPRVLPLTHPTARARVAFAVAKHACDERYQDSRARHLFRLSPEVDDRLDAFLVEKLGDQEFWREMTCQLEAVPAGVSMEEVLLEQGLATTVEVREAMRASPGPGERSLALTAGGTLDETIRRLAAGFIRSKPGALAVPYV